MKKVLTALACLLVLASTQAKAWTPFALFRGDGAAAAIAIYCPASLSANAQLALCNFGSGGGGGGAVTQSGAWNVSLIFGGSPVSSTNLLGVSDSALDALISGGKLPVSVVFPASQAVTLAALPLPAGASTAALQQSILTAIGTPAQAGGNVAVTNLPTTQAISAASLPLPAGAAVQASQIATQAPIAPAAATATTSMLIGCIYNTVAPTFTAGQQGGVACDAQGRPYTNVAAMPALIASAAQIGYVGLNANTIGAESMLSVINAAASAMGTAVKATAGTVYGYEVCNNTAAMLYFRMFNLTVAPTVGTSVPAIRKMVPAATCQSSLQTIGAAFGVGISFDATTGSLADADTTTIATASQVTVNVFYK